MTITVDGQLEIDIHRGVIYFHTSGGTVLRICRLKIPTHFDPNQDQIDITVGVERGVSYGSRV